MKHCIGSCVSSVISLICFKDHEFALLYQGQPPSPLACAQGTLAHNICLSQTSAAFQLITSVFPRCFNSRRGGNPYWTVTLTFLRGFEQIREWLIKPIMPDCYLWTKPPGKLPLRWAGWCWAAHLLSHPGRQLSSHVVPTPLLSPLLNWHSGFPALHVSNAVCKGVS